MTPRRTEGSPHLPSDQGDRAESRRQSDRSSAPLRARVPNSARLRVSAVARPSGIGDGQAAASALESPARVADRQINAAPTTQSMLDKLFREKILGGL